MNSITGSEISKPMSLLQIAVFSLLCSTSAFSQSPVLDYRFDGDYLDSSSSANRGIASGNASITTISNDVAAGSGALSLDGADTSYVDLDTSLVFSNSQPWSSVFWARRNQLDSKRSMIMGDRNNTTDFIWLNDNFTGLRFRSTANTTLDFSVPQDTALHHYALVADGAGDLDLFRDGSFVQSRTGDTSFRITSIGKAYSSSGYVFDGIIDEVHVYTNALTSSQVYSIYTNEYSEPAPAPPVDRVRVFLQGGQSNADGRAAPSGQPSYPDVDLFYRVQGGGSGTLSTLSAGVSETGQFGPELGFGRRLTDLLGCASTTRVAVIKYANGGTNLRNDWKAGGTETTAGDGSDYVSFQEAVSNGLASLGSRYTGAVVSVEGMIWMQGESDAKNGFTNDYFSNLTNFIADVRATFGTDLPFVIGCLSDAQTDISAPALAAVQDAQSAIASADYRTGLVNTDAMSMKPDNLHFDVGGQLALGRAFASETAYLVWAASQLSPAEIDAGKGEPDADPDMDGVVNIDEFISGTDPATHNSGFVISIVALVNDEVEIQQPSHPGRLYQVESCTNLMNRSWTTNIVIAKGISGTLTHAITNHHPRSFFRIRAQLP